MGQRESIYKTLRVAAPSPPSPNATVAAITVELRVFYPPGTDPATIAGLMSEVHWDAIGELLRNHSSSGTN